MRILLDIDGVVANLVGHLCTTTRIDALPADFTYYEFDRVLSSSEMEAVDRMMRYPGYAQQIPWYLGGRRFIDKLQRLGEVIAVTRPYADSPTWAYDRQQWIQRSYRDMQVVHTAHKELVRGDVLIEDHAVNLDRWLVAHPEGRGVLIDRPWNRSVKTLPDRMYRAQTYTEALELVEACQS